jgi:O-antigen/teichoic acid export membrane protein
MSADGPANETPGELSEQAPVGDSISVRAVKDTASPFAAGLLTALFSAFFGAWLTRLLPVKELAVWPIATQMGTLIAGLSSLGVGDLLVRRVPRMIAKGDREAAAALIRTGMLANGAVALAVTGLIYWQAESVGRYLLHDDNKASLIRMMALAGLLWGLQERTNWALTAVQAFQVRARMSAVMGPVRTPLWVVSYLLGGVYGLMLGMNVYALVGFIWTGLILRPHLRFSRRLYSPAEMLRPSLPFYGVSLLSLLNGRINYILIGLIATPEVLGTYYVAESVVSYLRMLGGYAADAAAPKLAERAARGEVELTRLFRKCTHYTAIGVYPICLLGAILGPLMCRVYGGAKYTDAGIFVTIICVSLLMEMMLGLHLASLRAFAPPWHTFINEMLGSLANFLPLVILVPLCGSLGAALAALVAMSLKAVLSGWMLSRTFRPQYDWLALQKVLWAAVPSAVMGIACYAVLGTRPWVLLPAGALCSMAFALGLARQLEERDLRLVEAALPEVVRRRAMTKRILIALSWLWVGPAQTKGTSIL